MWNKFFKKIISNRVRKIFLILIIAGFSLAGPNSLSQATTVATPPNDEYLGRQWGLPDIKALESWEVTSGNPDVKIAILDSGIDIDHPDLASKVVVSVNFTNSPTVYDILGHGTHVAGIAAAVTNNSIGIAGTGYNCNLMNVKVANDRGESSSSWLAQGIIWAADNGADVINLSLVGGRFCSTVRSAVNYAWNKGVVLVASAGNNRSSMPIFPAAFPNCIAVAATDENDSLAFFSNFGDWVDVAAPGTYIYSTMPNNNYKYYSGTSMSAPFVSGLAGLLFTTALDPKINTITDFNENGRVNDEIRYVIENNSDDIGLPIKYGKINIEAAVTPTPQPPLPTPPKVECQEVFLGQVFKRILEIQNEIPLHLLKMKQRYEEIFPHAKKCVKLFEECQAYRCCGGAPGANCGCGAGGCGGEPCPPGTELMLAEELKEVKRLNELVQDRAEILKNFNQEIEELKTESDRLKGILANRDPETKVWTCSELKALNVVKSCEAENDYYICKGLLE